MDKHRIRNVIPPLYAALIIGGFLINATVGVIVVIFGGMLSGLFWSIFSGGGSTGAGTGRGADRSSRAERRADRR